MTDSKGDLIVMGRNTELVISDSEKRERGRYKLPYGAKLLVDDNANVKKGDKILFGKWSGTEVKMNSEEYLIMKESDIMGILTAGKKKK